RPRAPWGPAPPPAGTKRRKSFRGPARFARSVLSQHERCVDSSSPARLARFSPRQTPGSPRAPPAGKRCKSFRGSALFARSVLSEHERRMESSSPARLARFSPGQAAARPHRGGGKALRPRAPRRPPSPRPRRDLRVPRRQIPAACGVAPRADMGTSVRPSRLGYVDQLIVSGAREHNLKDVTVAIPRGSLTVITGLSGSGKSSLAFDTIYAEGQRRYVESLSAYARQFLGQMDKPDVDSIEGLSPAISIDQKTTSRNPRSTVGTVTEIYDYLRLLWARVGVPHCHVCGERITGQSLEQIADQVLELPEGTRFMVLAPVVRGREGEYGKLLEDLRAEGFARVLVDGELRALDEEIALEKKLKHEIAVVVDRLVMRADVRKRLADSVETAAALADGI